MDTSSRYVVVQSRMAERHAEAARSRLAKGDRFDEIGRSPITVAAKDVTVGRPSLLGRLARLRVRVGGTARVAGAGAR